MRGLRVVAGVQAVVTILLILDLALIGDPETALALLALGVIVYPVVIVTAFEVGARRPIPVARRANRWALVPFVGGPISARAFGHRSGSVWQPVTHR